MTLKQGSKLKGNSIQYVIESVLGQGTFGVTYKAKGFTKAKGAFGEVEVELPHPIAIKEFFMREINQRDADGSISGLSEGSLAYNYAKKFRKEAERLAVMDHPNIVHVMDFVEANNTFYYVMDFIDGEDITHYMKGKTLNETDAISIIKDVAGALCYMHEEHKMLHLDLKPGNIMRRKGDGHIFLIDFGLSKHYSDEGQPDTSTTIGLGTEGYAPLEQGKRASAQNSFRPTIDVYALGGTLFKMLTGETPPPASDILEDEELLEVIMNKHGVSQQLQKIIVEAMMPSAKRRTPSVSAFIEAIDNYNAEASSISNIVKDNIDEEATVYVEQDIDVSKREFAIDESQNETVSEVSQHEVSIEEVNSENADSDDVVIAEPTRYELISDEDYVDLGLSVKWASKNIGANSRLELGDRYSAIASNDKLNWNTIPESISNSDLDIANKLSNGKSMLPTRKQWKELIDKCEWHWAEVNGVVGYRVIGRNGNSIFLPSTGNSNTYYWSASKASKYRCFYYLYFNSYNYDIMYNILTGLNYIRPVSNK